VADNRMKPRENPCCNMTRLDDSLKGEFVQFKSVGESSQSGHKDADKLKRAAFSNRIRHFVFQLSF